MKHVFLILALLFTFQVQAQDELPSPEAFAKNCLDDMVFFIQQATETLTKAEVNSDGMEPRLMEDIEPSMARLKFKGEFCQDMAEFLGEEYVIQLDKVRKGPEVKLAFYKFAKAFEKMGLQFAPNLDPEDIFENQLLKEAEERRLNSLQETYKMAIYQKVKRNWIRPAGSEEVPECWVRVLQGPGGIILDVTFGDCKGSTVSYRASIENAVYKAEPLPKPADQSLFERELNFNFRPE